MKKNYIAPKMTISELYVKNVMAASDPLSKNDIDIEDLENWD